MVLEALDPVFDTDAAGDLDGNIVEALGPLLLDESGDLDGNAVEALGPLALDITASDLDGNALEALGPLAVAEQDILAALG